MPNNIQMPFASIINNQDLLLHFLSFVDDASFINLKAVNKEIKDVLESIQFYKGINEQHPNYNNWLQKHSLMQHNLLNWAEKYISKRENDPAFDKNELASHKNFLANRYRSMFDNNWSGTLDEFQNNLHELNKQLSELTMLLPSDHIYFKISKLLQEIQAMPFGDYYNSHPIFQNQKMQAFSACMASLFFLGIFLSGPMTAWWLPNKFDNFGIYVYFALPFVFSGIALCFCLCSCKCWNASIPEKNYYSRLDISYLIQSHKTLLKEIANKFPEDFKDIKTIRQLEDILSEKVPISQQLAMTNMLGKLYTELKALNEEMQTFVQNTAANFQPDKISWNKYCDGKESLKNKYAHAMQSFFHWRNPQTQGTQSSTEACIEVVNLPTSESNEFTPLLLKRG